MIKYWFLCLIVIIFNTQLNYVNSQVVGRLCVVELTGVTGSCKLITQCRPVLETLKSMRPTRCGHEGTILVVCCPNPPTPPTTQAPFPIETLNSIRHLKCIEYAKNVYEITERIPLLNGTIYEHRIDRCGSTAIPLIVGGTAAAPREFPHSALLGYQINDGSIAWECGGSLVSEYFVVTAGHCLRSRHNGPVKFVKLGDLNIESEIDEARPETIKIDEIIRYPEYTTLLQYNDIALLRLERQATLSPYIRPICLPLVNITSDRVIATGWGAVEWAGNKSSSLLKVTLDLFPYSHCNESYRYDINRKLPLGLIEETQICAGSKNSTSDTCQGDSGGPLQIYHPNIYCMYILAGVTSFGKGCGTANVPGIYTNVAMYIDWMESVIWPN